MNWKKEPLGKICKTTSGGTPSRKNQSYYQNGTIPWVKSGELENNIITTSEEFITEEGLLNSSAKIFPAGTLLIALYGATIGKLAFLGIDAATNQAVCGIFQNENVSLKYLYYYLLFQRPNLIKQGVGGAQPNISQTILKKLEISYPDSITEQQRIVARIEELFSELDKAVDTLKTTKEQLEVYRQAVLKAAFEGKYTKWWRKNHNVSANEEYCELRKENQVFKDTSGDENELSLNIPDEWMKVRLGEIFDVEVGATPSRQHAEYWNGSIPWVSSGEVRFTTINKTREMITDIGLKNASTNLQPIGTVLLAMIGEGKTRGQSAILNIPAAHNQNTAAILVSKTLCQPKYIYYFLQLNYENTRRVGSGNNQKALNKERVRAIRVPFAPIAEQSIIVKEIEKRLSICENIEQTVNTALAQADAMRQSILKQAFEGKIQ